MLFVFLRIYLYIDKLTKDIRHDVVSVWYTPCFIFCQVDAIRCSKVRRYCYRFSVL